MLRLVKSQLKILRQVKSQSQILTLLTDFENYHLEPLMWTQSSPELEPLDKGDLGLLAGEASPEALFKGVKV